MIQKIEKILAEETAGDPISGLKWTKKTLIKISEQLNEGGIEICPNTVKKLLIQMNYSLKINYKRFESNPKKATPESRQKRDRQFKYIQQVKTDFMNRENAVIISVDSKKKELIGEFYNKGSNWCKKSMDVNAYDFPSDAEGILIPYGIYDLKHNNGFIIGGTSSNTSEFAVNSIEKWVIDQKKKTNIKSILILADGGGSNGSRNKMWKYYLQKKVSEKYNIELTICHYPPGTSKFNPIEHRLFSEISKNWSGQPLKDYETALKFIRTTSTKTGLKIKARLDKREYQTGIKITEEQLEEINIKEHNTFPKWNYTIVP